MVTLKCKICGGTLEVDSKNGLGVCEYCGTKQALPLFYDDSAKLLYERGNNYLLQSEYDKAEITFGKLLTINPNAAELYWDLVLCKYGVTYVKDPSTNKYIPTCNRTHFSSIFSDENYLKAIELSAGEKRELFKSDAKIIDNIQKGIIAVSKKEKPFDIFISYKETDVHGKRTKDSVVAESIYEKLTEAGYKVFFSRITLEDKIGTEYEPYIYAALYSSKVMLAIGSSKENFEAPWVKNEWSRFLHLRQKDASKTLIPLYFYMDQSDLPEEFLILQSQDMNTEQFDKQLLRGVKKLIPLPVMLAQKRKKVKKIIIASMASLCAVVICLSAVFIPKMLEKAQFGEQYDAAMQLYYNGEYPEATWAFETMGEYNDAADMKEKAELSWRKSLATVCSESDWTSAYYVNENGTPSLFKGIDGDFHTKIDTAKNGSVISLKCNGMYNSNSDTLTALHEDGQVSNPDFDSVVANNSEWYDIIKVSDSMQGMGVVGLRADGKMVILPFQYEMQNADGSVVTYNGESELLTELSTWENIVDFKHDFQGSQGVSAGLMVGLKSDGTLCAIQLANSSYELEEWGYDMANVANTLKKFKNVKNFAIDSVYPTGINIVALTNDGKLLTCSNGEITETTGKDICDIISVDIVLKTNGDLVELESGKVLLRDIVYAEDNIDGFYAVTRNGYINTIDKIFEQTSEKVRYEITTTENKVTVHKEWLERLD